MSIIFAGMEDRAPAMLPASDTRPGLSPIGAIVGVVVASITAGAEALLSALEALRATGHSAALIHNRWTTHGTWEVRAVKIREY